MLQSLVMHRFKWRKSKLYPVFSIFWCRLNNFFFCFDFVYETVVFSLYFKSTLYSSLFFAPH